MDFIRESEDQESAALEARGGLAVKQVLVAIAILLGVLTLFHGPLVWGSMLYCGGDHVNYFLPLRDQQLRHGWFAGWGPETFSGYPLLDNIQSGAFYPLNWLHLIWRVPERAATALVLLNLMVGGVGMFCLLRQWCGMTMAILGASAWMCGGYQLGRFSIGISIFAESLAWVPWMLWACERQFWGASTERRWVGILGVLGGVQLLAGAPQIVQITWGGLAVWTAFRLFEPGRRLDIVKGFLAAAAISLMIAWPMLIGAMRFQSQAVQREEAGVEFLVSDSLHPHLLLTWVAPGFFMPGNFEGLYWGSGTGWPETNGFIGAGLLMAGLAGLVSGLVRWRSSKPGERRLAATLLALAALGLVVGLGGHTPVFGWLASYVPSFGLFRVPARWSLWLVVALIIAGCRVMESLAQGRRLPEAWATMGIFLLAIIAAQLFLRPLLHALNVPQGDRGIDELFGAPARSAVTVAASAAALTLGLLFAALRLPAHAPRLLVVVALVGLVDLRLMWSPFTIPVGTKPHPLSLVSDVPHHRIAADLFRPHFYPESPLVDEMRTTPGRVHYTDTVIGYQFDQDLPELQTERPASLGFLSTRGYQQMRLALYDAEYYGSHGPMPPVSNPFLAMMEFGDRRFLDAYNVSLVLSHPAPGVEAGLARLGLEPRETAGPAPLKAWSNPGARGEMWLSGSSEFLDAVPDPSIGDFGFAKLEAGRWSVEVTTKGPAWFHFSSPEYHGWKLEATSDNGEVVVGDSSRSVLIPAAGRWVLTRTLDRIGLRPGNLLIGLLGLLAAVWLAVGRRRA